MSSVTTSASSRVASRASSTVVIRDHPSLPASSLARTRRNTFGLLARSGAGGDVQASSEQAGLDGLELGGVGRDPVVVRLRVEGAKPVAMADAGGAPGGGGGEELSGDVLRVYDVEARPVEQFAPVRADDGGWAGHRAAAALCGCQPGREMDRREGEAPARAEQMVHGSQHGELRPQSTQQVV